MRAATQRSLPRLVTPAVVPLSGYVMYLRVSPGFTDSFFEEMYCTPVRMLLVSRETYQRWFSV